MSNGRYCILDEKTRSKWLNIEVLPRNECANTATAIDEDSPEFHRFVANEELAFYQGNAVTWWNFYLTSRQSHKREAFNQVQRRDVNKSLSDKVGSKLNSSSSKDGINSVVTITIFHQPGCGASTSARQVLWDFHRKLRCIIVHRAIQPTVKEIVEVRQFGYAKDEDQIPPVLVLLDALDDIEVIDLIAQLENETKDNDCLTCIILHCKRTPDPDVMAKTNGMNSVIIEHKLTPTEWKLV